MLAVSGARLEIFAALFLGILGSVAIVFVVDYVLFVGGTWSGWQMVTNSVSRDDIAWWKSQVGPLPPPTNTGFFVLPTPITGLNGFNGNSTVGATGRQLPDGLLSLNIVSESKSIQGGVLLSRTKYAWHIGVELPGGMAFERVYIGMPGYTPSHPALWGWHFRILPIGLAVNSLFAAGPLLVIVILLSRPTAKTLYRIRAKFRRSRGQCEACAYILIAEQKVCSECGHHRQPIEQ
ncbi:MAG: hypothetical protein IH984_16840 [Planctomycetes bacterium]|nr:hypothetical protein [Planctomycetota bacterium]